MIVLRCLVALVLLGASPTRPFTSSPAGDGYVFQRKEFSRLSLRVTVHEHQSRDGILAAWRRDYPKVGAPGGLLAYSRWDINGCDIEVLDPDVAYEPEIIGHEMSHCLHGRFHPGQERAR